jgi:beta-lactamase class A
MTFTRPPHPDRLPDAPRSAPDPSRRAFLAGLTTLFATAGFSLMPQSSAAGPRDYRTRSGTVATITRSPPRPDGFQAGNHLSAEINSYIQGLRRAGRIPANERTAWLIYDFTSRRYLVTINASVPHQGASMIKPFVALAFFHKVREGKLQYTPYRRRRMEAMIQSSNNEATNFFIDLVGQTSRRSGPAEVEHTLKRHHPGVFRQTRIVERIPPGGRTYRNRASALDYHRFLHALWYDQLPYSGELKRVMHLPNRSRLHTGVPQVARETQILHKSGTTAQMCGNIGILIAQGQNGRRYPYTFVGIIEKSQRAGNFTAWKDDRGDVIRKVSGITYNHLQRLYNLV